MTAAVKIATWNIGGGVLGASHQQNGTPRLDHHVAVLREHGPDVVCLQEAHDYRGARESQAEYLAREADYPHLASFPVSESHLERGAWLALAVLSRFPLRDSEYKRFPNPGLSGTGPHGDTWTLHDKGYVTTTVELGGAGLGLVNAHCFPLRHFGASPSEARFRPVWDVLTAGLAEVRSARPAVAGLDLNHDRVADVLGEALRPGGYLNALENTATTAKGVQRDYVLYDRRLRLLATTVTATRSDHSFCQARFLV